MAFQPLHQLNLFHPVARQSVLAVAIEKPSLPSLLGAPLVERPPKSYTQCVKEDCEAPRKVRSHFGSQ
jgi:hypothetical protein